MNQPQPLVTVFMPVYNASGFLRISIESVLNQTFRDFEFLIIDDGSEDNSCKIIKGYNDPRIRLIEKEHNYIETINLGFDLAKGKYLARMDSDDKMLDKRLKVQVEFMEKNQDITICGSSILNDHFQIFTSNNEIVNRMILKNPIVHPTAIMRLSDIRKHNLKYEEEYIYAEDYKFWISVAKTGKLANIKEPLLYYRFHKNNVSSLYQEVQKENAFKVRDEAVKFFISNLNNSVKNEISDLDKQLNRLIQSGLLNKELYYEILYNISTNCKH